MKCQSHSTCVTCFLVGDGDVMRVCGDGVVDAAYFVSAVTVFVGALISSMFLLCVTAAC